MEINKGYDINTLPDGIYNLQPTALGRKTTMPGLIEMGLDCLCPYCHSSKIKLVITGTSRQYHCKQCGQPFRPPEK